MSLFPVAGSKIYVGGALDTKNSDFVEADFNGQSFVEIDGWQTAGDIGDEASVINTALINRGRVIKQKGTRDSGQMENRFAILPEDDGQLALIAGEKTEDNYAFKIEWEGGDVTFFIALISSARYIGGEANTVRLLRGLLEINSNLVNVAAP